MPTVSVIVPAYNASRFLGDALESVLCQTWKDWEVCLVDDGSTDSTRAVVQSFMPRFGSRLRYLYQPNRGLSRARNVAMLNSTGEIFALLDADDVWQPHHLQQGVASLSANPGLGLIHAAVARIDVDGRIIEYPPRPHARYLSGRIVRYIYTRRAHILCPTVMFRRRCMDVVGMFDESMRSTEDRDLWFRIAEHFEIGYLPEIHAYYRISPNSLSRDREAMLASQIFFIHKHRRRGVSSRMAYHEALGNILRERGDDEFRAGNFRLALNHYGKSVLRYPMSAANVYMLVRALAEPFLARIRGIRLHSRSDTA